MILEGLELCSSSLLRLRQLQLLSTLLFFHHYSAASCWWGRGGTRPRSHVPFPAGVLLRGCKQRDPRSIGSNFLLFNRIAAYYILTIKNKKSFADFIILFRLASIGYFNLLRDFCQLALKLAQMPSAMCPYACQSHLKRQTPLPMGSRDLKPCKSSLEPLKSKGAGEWAKANISLSLFNREMKCCL